MKKTDVPSLIHTDPVSIPSNVYVAAGARLIGDVRLGKNSSVWYNAVLRGDIHHISIGDRTNIQDNCVIHLENDRPCVVGNDVTVGHGAILHGCTVEDGCLIGMGATLLNGVCLGKGSVVGAGCVIKEHTIVADFSLVVGVPGKVVKQLPITTLDEHKAWAAKYVELSKIHARRYKEKES